MDSRRLPKIIIPLLRTRQKTEPNEEPNRLREQEESLNTYVSYWTKYRKDTEPERKMTERLLSQRAPYASTAYYNEVSGKDKRFKKPFSCKAEQKPVTQDLKEKEVAKHDLEEKKFSKEMAKQESNEGFPPIFQHKRPEKVPSQQDCKKIVYDNLEEIKRKETASYILLEKKRRAERAKQQLHQKLQEEQEREKKDSMKQILTDTWDTQVKFKKQKKMEKAEIESLQMAAIMEADRLCQIEDIEARRHKKEKDRKFFKQDETEQNTEAKVTMQSEIHESFSDKKEDVQSESNCPKHLSEKRLPEKLNSLEDCKKVVFENLDCIKRKEAANFVILDEKRCKERAKQQLRQKFEEQQEREKKVNLKKSLAETLDSQIEGKEQKKKHRVEIERQQMAAIMQSDRLHENEEMEMKRQKKEKSQKFLRHNETQLNKKEQKKSISNSLKDILKEETDYDVLLQNKHCNKMAKDEVTKLSHEIQQQEKTPKQKPLADELAARHQYKQTKKVEMDRNERQGVLPGYRGEEIGARRQKKEVQQKLQDNISEQRRAVLYQSVVPDNDSDIDDKDRSREIRQKIVYNQLSLIKKKEDAKRTIMEDRSLKEMKHREAAEQKLEKLAKEKKAAATKSLTDSWDYQIRRKQQEKKELREAERKDMLSLIELERVCGGERIKSIHLDKRKQPVYDDVKETLPAARPERSCSKSCEGRTTYSDKHDEGKTSKVCRPSLSRQKVTNTNTVKLPSLNSKSVHFSENCQQSSKSGKLPSKEVWEAALRLPAP